MPTNDEFLSKKASSSAKASSKSNASSTSMLRVVRLTRVAGVLLGGFVSLVGVMSLVGLITDNFWVRICVAAVVVVALPAFVADRLLKRASGSLAMLANVFSFVLLGVALLFVSVDFVSKPLFVREGDRYARSGSRIMARVVYFLGGVSPVFPDEKTAAGADGVTTASAAPDVDASATDASTK